jgi:hypothetical protein
VTDTRTLADLVAFARVEVAAGDIEPWAAVLAQCREQGFLDGEGAAWAVKCYNAFDDFGSAFTLMARWPSPAAWARAADTSPAGKLACGVERRNLRGGLVRRHLDSYVTALGAQCQMRWLAEGIPPGDPAAAFYPLMSYLRRSCWGTGRLAAFEWAEFTGKALGLPVTAPDGCLWESSGPRESLERIFNGGRRAPGRRWLEDRARQVRDLLAAEGVPLEWWDLETVICDFNVMRKGRYYPGKHLAMISEEIAGLPDPYRTGLRAAYDAVIPPAWAAIRPGVDKTLNSAYARTGRIHAPRDLELT